MVWYGDGNGKRVGMGVGGCEGVSGNGVEACWRDLGDLESWIVGVSELRRG